jgi:site-specific DNA-methyltransferase (adenine-specific)
VSYRLICGDAIEELRKLPEASVDCVVVDPPYGDTSCAWDIRVSGWASLALLAVKPSGSLWTFGSFRYFTENWAEFTAWRYAQEVIWEKHNGSNSFADRFRRVHEFAVQFYPLTSKWGDVYKSPVTTPTAVGRTVRRKQKAQHWSKIREGQYTSVDGGPALMRSVIYARSDHGRAVHPTQKPTEILEHLIEYSCPVGGVVLDPFCGSGSTGVAAQRGKRNFVGIELNPEYVALSEKRIREDAPLFRSPEVPPDREKLFL